MTTDFQTPSSSPESTRKVRKTNTKYYHKHTHTHTNTNTHAQVGLKRENTKLPLILLLQKKDAIMRQSQQDYEKRNLKKRMRDSKKKKVSFTHPTIGAI